MWNDASCWPIWIECLEISTWKFVLIDESKLGLCIPHSGWIQRGLGMCVWCMDVSVCWQYAAVVIIDRKITMIRNWKNVLICAVFNCCDDKKSNVKHEISAEPFNWRVKRFFSIADCRRNQIVCRLKWNNWHLYVRRLLFVYEIFSSLTSRMSWSQHTITAWRCVRIKRKWISNSSVWRSDVNS